MLCRIGIERLVEDLIQDSMARGDFDNWITYAPKLAKPTHNATQACKRNGNPS